MKSKLRILAPCYYHNDRRSEKGQNDWRHLGNASPEPGEIELQLGRSTPFPLDFGRTNELPILTDMPP